MSDALSVPAPFQTGEDDSPRSGILVTVEHGDARTTLSVPDGLAVELLLPLVVSACGADATATWALVPRGGEPVDGESTLREAGVWQGAVLALRQTAGGERRPPRRPKPARGGQAERLPRGQRLGLALRAARTGAWPGQGRVSRARTAWRDSGHIARLERAIAEAPRQRGVVIAVISLRPGCGKTTAATLLASLLAKARSQPPLIVDGDLASRALSRQMAPTFRMPSARYAEVVARRVRLADLRPAPIGPNGIRLLPAPDHPAVAPDAGECGALIADLRASWGITLVDCAAGFQTAWSLAAWNEADQFVVVAEDRPAELAALEPVKERLTESGVAAAVVSLRQDPVAAALLRAGELAWEAAPEPWRSSVAGALATLAAKW
jgi:Mrp family chromosome partitioning ATPase